MDNQTIINEATKLGNAKVGTNEVQARALELEAETGLIFSGSSPHRAIAGTASHIFWTTYHEVKNEAFRVSGNKSRKLTPEQVARAKEIIQAQRDEEFRHLVWKYQTRSRYSRSNPVPTGTLRKWANSGTDMRNHHYLRHALRQAGEL